MPRSLLIPLYQKTARILQRFCPQPPVIAPGLDKTHLTHTVLLPDRLALLDWMPKKGRVAECGVDEGHFSAQILERCQPDEMILIDSWESARFSEQKLRGVKARFEQEIGNYRVRIVREASVVGLASLDDGELSWAYIDTSHDYKTTAQELRLCAQKVCPGGVIAGHDYTIGNWGNYYRYGVVEAVNEFCIEEGWGFAALTHEPDRLLSFALRRLNSLQTPLKAVFDTPGSEPCVL